MMLLCKAGSICAMTILKDEIVFIFQNFNEKITNKNSIKFNFKSSKPPFPPRTASICLGSNELYDTVLKNVIPFLNNYHGTLPVALGTQKCFSGLRS